MASFYTSASFRCAIIKSYLRSITTRRASSRWWLNVEMQSIMKFTWFAEQAEAATNKKQLRINYNNKNSSRSSSTITSYVDDENTLHTFGCIVSLFPSIHRATAFVACVYELFRIFCVCPSYLPIRPTCSFDGRRSEKSFIRLIFLIPAHIMGFHGLERAHLHLMRAMNAIDRCLSMPFNASNTSNSSNLSENQNISWSR